MLKSNKWRGQPVFGEQSERFVMCGRKREGHWPSHTLHLHSNPDFPMFDPFSLCRFKSVARLVTNTSLIQPCRTFLSYSITVTQIQHKTGKSKQRMINSILNLFVYMKNRMQLNPLWPHPSLEVTWVANELFSFHSNYCCFPMGTKGGPRAWTFLEVKSYYWLRNYNLSKGGLYSPKILSVRGWAFPLISLIHVHKCPRFKSTEMKVCISNGCLRLPLLFETPLMFETPISSIHNLHCVRTSVLSEVSWLNNYLTFYLSSMPLGADF